MAELQRRPRAMDGLLDFLVQHQEEQRRAELRSTRAHYAAALRETAIDVRRDGKLDTAHVLELMADDFEAGYPISKLRGYRTDEDAGG